MDEVNVPKITISVRMHIKLNDIADLLDSASRGSSYWSDSSKLGYESMVKTALSEVGCEIQDTEEDRNYWLNLAKIKRGLTVMAKKFPKHFADFLKDDFDANTGDIFLQCCLFGEVIYG